jgi:23S rRNA (cytosine1962-C5)-methyltransferase
MAKLILKDKFMDLVKDGHPGIFPGLFTDKNKIERLAEGEIVNIYSAKKEFIAKGYLGVENRNIGWILSYDNEEINQNYFSKKMAKAVSYRQKLFMDPETTAFRLFNAVGDDIGGFVVDYYDGFALIQWYNEGIYQFKDMIYKAINDIVFPRGIYEKKRFGNNGSYIKGDSFVSGERMDDNFEILENGVKYIVNLNDGAMTGIFLDQREVRKVIKEKYANGRKVLNTFSYTGAFSVASAVGGASETISLDLAKRSVEMTRNNFEANGIDLENHSIIVDDVFNFYKKGSLNHVTGEYDMVILDPPSFSRSKDHVFSVEKDYKKLVENFSVLLKNNGILVASTNHSKLSYEDFEYRVTRGLRNNGFRFRIEEKFTQSSDFKWNDNFEESKYLKVLVIKVYR